MARRLRLQYPGALYHVINRGNYRRDVFETVGAAKAFELALGEACERHAWRVHGYGIMRNHFHLALETPEPNLIEGMHWLQSTFATRFNRFRSERGHLFQGRYQSPLIENAAALVRVVDYIHLNPLRAGLVQAAQIADFRWGSLSHFVRRSCPAWLVPTEVLGQFGLANTVEGWASYVLRLAGLSRNPADVERDKKELTTGWAIGSQGWRRAIAREYSHLALCTGFESAELCEIKNARWRKLLDGLMARFGKTEMDVFQDPAGAPWKIALAAKLRREGAAPHRWIAQALNMGKPSTVRAYVCRFGAIGAG